VATERMGLDGVQFMGVVSSYMVLHGRRWVYEVKPIRIELQDCRSAELLDFNVPKQYRSYVTLRGFVHCEFWTQI
jgi:hypothetical protein